MKKVLSALAIVAVIIVGCAVVASNMGFKYNYTLLNSADAGSNSGTNVIALPYFRADGINLASELQNSVGFADVANIQAFDRADDSLGVGSWPLSCLAGSCNDKGVRSIFRSGRDGIAKGIETRLRWLVQLRADIRARDGILLIAEEPPPL